MSPDHHLAHWTAVARNEWFPFHRYRLFRSRTQFDEGWHANASFAARLREPVVLEFRRPSYRHRDSETGKHGLRFLLDGRHLHVTGDTVAALYRCPLPVALDNLSALPFAEWAGYLAMSERPYVAEPASEWAIAHWAGFRLAVDQVNHQPWRMAPLPEPPLSEIENRNS